MRATVSANEILKQTTLFAKPYLNSDRPNTKPAHQEKHLEIALLLPGFALGGKIDIIPLTELSGQ